MKRYKRILVCVDRPERDVRLLEYAGGRSRVAESEKVYFLHVAEDRPPTADEPATEPAAPEAISRETLERLVADHFSGHGQEELHCEVVRGSPLLETLRFAHDSDVDLILMDRRFGRKGDLEDEAVLPRRIARKATCSVLVLPEEYQLQADEIIVPVRDSECSVNALELACDIASATGAAVTALNIFHVTAGYSRVGSSLEEHQALIAAAAEREVARLLKRVDTHGVQVACKCAPDVRGNPVPAILDVLGSGAAKAIVIGARGRTGAAGVLLGSVTEQLIRESPSPVLAVKKKGECLGILRALIALASEG